MAKSPKEIVDEVEEALANSTPCPYCGLFDGTHLVTCEYLKHKGNVDAAKDKRVSSKAEPREETKEAEVKAEGKEEAATKDADAQRFLDQMKTKEKK